MHIFSNLGNCRNAKWCNFNTPKMPTKYCRLKHCNNHLNLLNNKRKEKHGWTEVDKIEMLECSWEILKKVGLMFIKFMANCLDKGCFCSESLSFWCKDDFISKIIPHYNSQVLKVMIKIYFFLEIWLVPISTKIS